MDGFAHISYYEFILRCTGYGRSSSGSSEEVEKLVSEMGFFCHDETGRSHSFISTITEQGSLVPG